MPISVRQSVETMAMILDEKMWVEVPTIFVEGKSVYVQWNAFSDGTAPGQFKFLLGCPSVDESWKGVSPDDAKIMLIKRIKDCIPEKYLNSFTRLTRGDDSGYVAWIGKIKDVGNIKPEETSFFAAIVLAGDMEGTGLITPANYVDSKVQAVLNG